MDGMGMSCVPEASYQMRAGCSAGVLYVLYCTYCDVRISSKQQISEHLEILAHHAILNIRIYI